MPPVLLCPCHSGNCSHRAQEPYLTPSFFIAAIISQLFPRLDVPSRFFTPFLRILERVTQRFQRPVPALFLTFLISAETDLRHMLDLKLQLPCRHAAGSLTDSDELLQPITGRHRDLKLLRQAVRSAFNVAVRGLRSLRIDYIDIVLLLHGTIVIFDLIRVKDDDQRALAVSLIIAQDLDQPLPGRIQIILGQIPQLLPVMDDVIAIHEQTAGRCCKFTCTCSRCRSRRS